jgi:hypothetical protein
MTAKMPGMRAAFIEEPHLTEWMGLYCYGRAPAMQAKCKKAKAAGCAAATWVGIAEPVQGRYPSDIPTQAKDPPPEREKSPCSVPVGAL